jgi:hypothetical protein
LAAIKIILKTKKVRIELTLITVSHEFPGGIYVNNPNNMIFFEGIVICFSVSIPDLISGKGRIGQNKYWVIKKSDGA